jgi:hypothetical protein
MHIHCTHTRGNVSVCVAHKLLDDLADSGADLGDDLAKRAEEAFTKAEVSLRKLDAPRGHLHAHRSGACAHTKLLSLSPRLCSPPAPSFKARLSCTNDVK